MKKLISLAAILCLLFSCEKSAFRSNSIYTARIVGFDLNCSTCILDFPDDSLEVKGEIGKSPGNQYQAINLAKDNFKIGQKLKVKIRKVETSEIRECITLYPTYNYKDVFITDFEASDNWIINDTISLSYQDCLSDPAKQRYICLDSVLNDSRCPTGAYCIWEGNAEVRFKYERFNEVPISFSLNTHMSFTRDTIIDGYKFSLIGVSPHPSLEHRIMQKDYKAEILVEKKK